MKFCILQRTVWCVTVCAIWCALQRSLDECVRAAAERVLSFPSAIDMHPAPTLRMAFLRLRRRLQISYLTYLREGISVTDACVMYGVCTAERLSYIHNVYTMFIERYGANSVTGAWIRQSALRSAHRAWQSRASRSLTVRPSAAVSHGDLLMFCVRSNVWQNVEPELTGKFWYFIESLAFHVAFSFFYRSFHLIS